MATRISVVTVGKMNGRKVFSIVTKPRRAKTFEFNQILGTVVYYPNDFAHLTLDTTAIKKHLYEGAIPTEKANYYLSKVDLVPVHYEELSKKGICRVQDPRTWDIKMVNSHNPNDSPIFSGWMAKLALGRCKTPIKAPKLPDFSNKLPSSIFTESTESLEKYLEIPKYENLRDVLNRIGVTKVDDILIQRYLRALSGFH